MKAWSHSLDNMVRTCERKVFLSARFASATAAKDSIKYEAFLLKQALDLPNWRGRLVHTAICNKVIPALQRSHWPDFGLVRAFATELLDEQAAFSKAGLYREQSKTQAGDSYCVLRSDLRGQGLSTSDREKVRNEVIGAINVLESKNGDLLDRIRRATFVLADEKIAFRLDEEILVDVRPDVLFIEQNDHGVILDWKAVESTNTNARRQLLAYAFGVLACKRWPRLRVDNMELIEVNLVRGESVAMPVSRLELDHVDERIFFGAEMLRAIFEVPIDACTAGDFAPARSPVVCQYCSVLEVCNGKLSKQTAPTQPLLFELFPPWGARSA